MRVVYAPPALDDIRAITDYIARDSPINADRVKDRIFETIDLLADQPTIMGRAGRVGGTAELIINPYIVAYQVRGEIVEVLAVIDGRRGNIAGIIADRLDE